MIQSNVNITVEISHAQRSGGPGRECSPSYFLLFGTWLNIYSAVVLWCLLSFNFFSLQDSLKNVVSEFPDTNLHLLSPLKQSIYRSYMLGRAASWGKHLEASQDAEFISQEGWSHREKKKKKKPLQAATVPARENVPGQEWAGICSTGPEVRRSNS